MPWNWNAAKNSGKHRDHDRSGNCGRRTNRDHDRPDSRERRTNRDYYQQRRSGSTHQDHSESSDAAPDLGKGFQDFISSSWNSMPKRQYDKNWDSSRRECRSNSVMIDSSSESESAKPEFWSAAGFHSIATSLRQDRQEQAREQGKLKRRIEKMETNARVKECDRDWNQSDQMEYFMPTLICAHCEGNHYDHPPQKLPEFKNDGVLKDSTCPIQERFERDYGRDAVVKFVKQGEKCTLKMVKIKGTWFTCNGNHPEEVHIKVLEAMGLPTTPKRDDMVVRKYMSELPLRNKYGEMLCGKKKNNPPNEICILRSDEG